MYDNDKNSLKLPMIDDVDMTKMLSEFKKSLTDYIKKDEYNSGKLALDVPDNILDQFNKRLPMSSSNSKTISAKRLDAAFLHHSCKESVIQQSLKNNMDYILNTKEPDFTTFQNRQL